MSGFQNTVFHVLLTLLMSVNIVIIKPLDLIFLVKLAKIQIIVFPVTFYLPVSTCLIYLNIIACIMF